MQSGGAGTAEPTWIGPAQGEGPSTLRRDAARNRDKILAAARAAFDEEGVDVGVEVIAPRAGVGVRDRPLLHPPLTADQVRQAKVVTTLSDSSGRT